MIQALSIFFVLITISTFYLFSKAIGTDIYSKWLRKILVVWLILQAAISISGFYNKLPIGFPPKIFLLGILPALLFIVFLIFTKRQWIDSLSLKNIMFLNVIRVFVEIALFGLYIVHLAPKEMTFEGHNFDILVGLTAPIIVYYGFVKSTLSSKILLIWNILGLILLLIVVSIGFKSVLVAQNTMGILIFPFSWLPTFIVPVVLFGHLVAIRQLLKK